MPGFLLTVPCTVASEHHHGRTESFTLHTVIHQTSLMSLISPTSCIPLFPRILHLTTYVFPSLLHSFNSPVPLETRLVSASSPQARAFVLKGFASSPPSCSLQTHSRPLRYSQALLWSLVGPSRRVRLVDPDILWCRLCCSGHI